MFLCSLMFIMRVYEESGSSYLIWVSTITSEDIFIDFWSIVFLLRFRLLIL